jgi:hypothetical protein
LFGGGSTVKVFRVTLDQLAKISAALSALDAVSNNPDLPANAANVAREKYAPAHDAFNEILNNPIADI